MHNPIPLYSILRKKVSLLFFICLVNIGYAQAPKGYIFLGPQITTAKYSVEGMSQPTDSKIGFQAGYGIKIPFETNLNFSPAAFYSLKGYKVSFNRPSDPPDILASDNNTSIHSFELAFLFQYDFGRQPNHMFMKLGPTLDFQISGKEEYKLDGNGSASRNMIYSFGDYGRYSGNMLFQLGYETRGFMIFGQYSHGFVNLSNHDGGPGIFHRVYGLSVGKYFGKKASGQ
jgi:hypothetical protein